MVHDDHNPQPEDEDRWKDEDPEASRDTGDSQPEHVHPPESAGQGESLNTTEENSDPRLDEEQLVFLRPQDIEVAGSIKNRFFFPEAEMNTLMETLKDQGMNSPITVRLVNGRYRLVAGLRRLEAALRISLPWVPCRVRELTDAKAEAAMFIENSTREDPCHLELAWQYGELKRVRQLRGESVNRDALAAELKLAGGLLSELWTIDAAVSPEDIEVLGITDEQAVQLSKVALLRIAHAPAHERVRLILAEVGKITGEPAEGTIEPTSSPVGDSVTPPEPVGVPFRAIKHRDKSQSFRMRLAVMSKMDDDEKRQARSTLQPFLEALGFEVEDRKLRE